MRRGPVVPRMGPEVAELKAESIPAHRTVLLLHRGGPIVRGTETVLIQSAKAFDAAGYRVLVCRNQPCIDQPLQAASPSAQIIDFTFPELMIAGVRETSLSLSAYFGAFRRLKDLVARVRPEFIYCSGGLPCQLGIPVGRLSRTPVLCHFHHPAMRRVFYLWLVRYADKLVFPSAFVEQRSRPDLRGPGDVIYSGIDLARFRPERNRMPVWRARWGIAPEAIVIGQVGALASNKRPDFLITAFRALLNRVGKSLHLCLVGAGPMEGRLRRMVNDWGLASRVTLTGYVKDVLPYYQHVFDINVLVSREEGLGISVLEGSACGLPAVVTRCTGLPETVQESRTGLLFEVEDAEQLNAHLSTLAEQPERRVEMGRMGVGFVADRFAYVSYAQKLLASVRDMLEKAADPAHSPVE